MRLLILNYEYPPLGGGAGNATYFLAHQWGKQGHEADIVTTRFEGLEEISRDSDHVTVYRVDSRRKRIDQSNQLEMMSYVMKARSKSLQLCRTFPYDKVISFSQSRRA